MTILRYIARLITSPRAHFSVTSPRGQSLFDNGHRQFLQGALTVTIWELVFSLITQSRATHNMHNTGEYVGNLKGTTRVKFSNSHNVRKLHDNSVYINYRQPKPHIHTKDMVLVREYTPLFEAACTRECLAACQESSFQIRHHLRW